MADFVDRVRDEINSRLEQLRPAVDELRRLEEAAAALNGAAGTRASSAVAASAPRTTRRGRPPRRTAAPSRGGARRRPGRPKGSGGRSAQALTIVTEQPGITIPEIAAKMGIKQNYLYRILPGLEQEGKVEKQGRGWHPKAA